MAKPIRVLLKIYRGDSFKIKYDGFEYESWLLANQFTVINNNTPGYKL
jgi:hypothetical protein